MRHGGGAVGRRLLLIAGGILLALTVASVGGSQAAWTSGIVVDSSNSAKTGRLAFTHAYASAPSCVGEGPTGSACSGAPVPTGPATTTAQTVNDTLSNQTVGGGTYTQQVAVNSCAPARFANSATSGDPLLPRFRVGRNVPDPWGGTSAASFDGSTQYATDVVPTSTAGVASTSYTVGLWFKAEPGSSGGGLVSLNADPRAVTTSGPNPTVFLDSSGRIRAKFDGTPILIIPIIVTVESPSGRDYRDGQWHHVALTVTRNIALTDLALYVDGAEVHKRTGLVLLVGTLSDAWWHVGWTDTTALAGSPAAYFTGRLSGVFKTSAALSAGQIASLYTAGSSGAYSSLIASPQHVWMLGDGPNATFAGSVGYVGGGDACGHVRLGWTLGGTSAFAATAVNALPVLGWLPTSPAAAPAVGATQTLTTSYSRIASGYDSDVVGLELVTGLAHRVALVGSNWALDFTWSAVLLG